MDVDYHMEPASSGVLFNFSAPVASSVPVFSSSPKSTTSWQPVQSSSPPVTEVQPSSVPLFPSSSVSPLVFTTEKTTDMLEAGQKGLVRTLEEASKAFKEASRPSVVVINQLPPPSSPVPAWHQDPDLPAVGAAVGFLLLVVLVAGCFWLRRFRPSVWERVKAAGWRMATWVALPLSWLCGHAAVLLRHLHESAEGQQGTSASTVQVGETHSF